MSLRVLRFCPECLATQHAGAHESCVACGSTLLPQLDDRGALSRDFLAARGRCCANGCRNCPYPADTTSPQKTCERCGGEFECRATGCWCTALTLSPEALRWLRGRYADCLCPTCLAAYAAGQAIRSARTGGGR